MSDKTDVSHSPDESFPGWPAPGGGGRHKDRVDRADRTDMTSRPAALPRSRLLRSWLASLHRVRPAVRGPEDPTLPPARALLAPAALWQLGYLAVCLHAVALVAARPSALGSTLTSAGRPGQALVAVAVQAVAVLGATALWWVLAIAPSRR